MNKMILAVLLSISAMVVTAQTKVNPVIKNFGTVTEVPFSVENPVTGLGYKIVVEVSADNTKPAVVHDFFDKVAAVVNLHALGGVPAKKLQVVMVIHGPAAQFVLTNEGYQKKFGTDNPNIPLFKELVEAGVKIFVCGQSLNKRNVPIEGVTPEVKPALSAITTLTTYQLKGYAFLKY
ncbi:MAG: DsrE family protein [Chitinophagaceae bacterium]|nr:DsrE family protein [Chitinophagaceae bacterium]MDP1764034.1 DsrE family protein [Sediminibacterium sp.]MDP1811944.1 DsrE family protein [Sediminibacterium sp.]MDP3128410.1 DsrE family protein [Sediminibacterium sp.]MDP3665534.1 DsrE family protein [Sediminibacterium sp.]